MRWRLLISNVLLLGGLAWTAAWAGGGLGVARVLPQRDAPGARPSNLAALEATAALAPTASAVSALAGAYLDRNEPGLASAVLEQASREVQARPEVAELHARAVFHRGHAREALALAEQAQTACEPLGSCPAWLVAKTARQVAFFEQVVDAGIDDPHAEPRATRAAYDRSAHEVVLVAMR